jgi:hypothetical protein
MRVRRFPEGRKAEIPPELSRAVEYLNVLLALDQQVVSRIMDFRLVCSPAIENTPAPVLVDAIDQPTLSPLGIFGGFVNRGRFVLTGEWDENRKVFTEFFVGETVSG